MKKNYMTPCAQMNSIASRDVITLSWGGDENHVLALESEEVYKRDMTWKWE
jgi:hypothetical protein